MFKGFSNMFSNSKKSQKPQQNQQQNAQLNQVDDDLNIQQQIAPNVQVPHQRMYMQQQRNAYQQGGWEQAPAFHDLTEEVRNWKGVEDQLTKAHKKLSESAPIQVDLNEALQVKFSLENEPLYSSSKPQRQGIMISLEETIMGAVDDDTCRADVVCIIDVSGSMHGEKLDNVKKTLHYLLEVLVGSRIAIVVFDSTAQVMMNFKLVNEDNIPKIKQVIDHLHELNSTNITAGVQVSQDLVGNRLTSNPVCTMFLLSDGQHNIGPISNEILFNGDFARTKTEYTLHSFGYGDDHDAKLMQGMAERKGGNYYFVNDITRVDECFVDCLGMVTTTLATKAKLKLRLLPTPYYPEIRILKTYGSYWTKDSDIEASLNLHNIYAGIKKTYLLDVEFDGAKQLATARVTPIIANLELEFIEISKTKSTVITKSFQVVIVPENSEPQQKNFEVLKNIMRVRGAESMEIAENLRKAGNQKEALVVLQRFKEDLKQEQLLAEDELAKSLLAQIEQIIEMINNDINGVANAWKTENVMMQHKNLYMNEQSAPMFESKGMYANSKQTSNKMKLMSKKA